MKSLLRASFALSILLFLAVVAASQTGQYTVQIVAAPTQTEAEETVSQLKAKGVDAYVLKSFVSGKGTYYRVRVGAFRNANEARKYGETLKQKGVVPDFFIAPYEAPKESGSPEKPVAKTAAIPDKPETTKPEPAVKNAAKVKKDPATVPAKNPPATARANPAPKNPD